MEPTTAASQSQDDEESSSQPLGAEESLGAFSYRMLFETAVDAIIVHDRDTFEVLNANPAACSLLGYSLEELLGMSALDLSSDPESTRQTALEGTSRIPMRNMVAKNGETIPVEIVGNQFVLDGRDVRVVFLRDIRDRLLADAARYASENKFDAAFTSSPDAVILSRRSDGMFIEVNDAFARLTGYAADEILGKTASDIGLWNDPSDRQKLARALDENGFADNLEANFRIKNGDVRTGLLSARVADIGGEPCTISVTHDISARKLSEIELKRSKMRLEAMVREVTEAMGRVVEIRDPYTHGHQARVAQVSLLIAQEMGLSDDEMDSIEIAALVHDVGKLAVPAEILNKPGKLSTVEFGIIKAHPERGFEILRGIDFPWPTAAIVLQHHERMDGSGYPNGLAGEEILLAARILALADVVEAMASYRPYRPAMGLLAAIDEIREFAHRFDPDVSAACLRLHERGELAFLDE